jgi:restriction system protein
MARGVPPRPSGGGGRPPSPRPSSRQPRAQRAAPQRAPGADQQRLAEQQRRADQQRADQQRRTTAQADQQRQQQYLREASGARGQTEAERLAAEIDQQVARLESILWAGRQRSPGIDLAGLARVPAEPEFDPGPLGVPVPEPDWAGFAPGGLAARWVGRQARERREAAARAAYQRARSEWERAERQRAERLAAAEQAYQKRLGRARAEATAYNSRIARVAAGLRDRDPRVVESFLRTVLRRVPLPPGFPRRAEVTHHPVGEQLTLQLVLPGREVVPEFSGYEYAAPAGQPQPVARPVEAAADLYRRVIAQVSVLVVRDVLGAEPQLAGVTFHGLVDDQDPETGEPFLPCLVSFYADRSGFAGLDLAELSAAECLAKLDARVSSDPYHYQPVATVAEPA